MIDAYLRDALLPALGRQGVGPVGVFTSLDDPKDLSFTVLIAYRSLEVFAGVNPALKRDSAYLAAAKPYFDRSSKETAFTRIRSRFMKAFDGMPKIAVPKSGPRVFELRTYESHHEEAAWRKIAMFNEGEIGIMRDVELGPVFYGETLVSDDVPNLTYMTHATDMDAHKKHWDAFRTHPKWDKMKVMPRFADTVSKITKTFLKPTAYSQV